MSYILIIGGNSDIGKALANKYAKNGYNLFLGCRDLLAIEDFCLLVSKKNNVTVTAKKIDVTDYNSHIDFYSNLNPKPIGVISCVGYLDNQISSQNDWNECLKSINSNYVGIVSILNIIANDFIIRKNHGFIIGLTSVAGERGRASNYIYGSAKAGLSAYFSGLRNRLQKNNIKVMTVKPGYVKTKMTINLNLPKILTCSPEYISEKIYYYQQRGKDVLYVRWFWKYIMYVIKIIPESIFKKLSL